MLSAHPFWSLEVPRLDGQLLLTPCPGNQQVAMPLALAQLQLAGAGGVLTLMTKDALAARGAGSLGSLVRARGMAWFHLPVADEQVPLEDFGQGWKACKQSILERLNAGQDIAIHCKGGSGRTGLIAARIMIEAGIPRADAIALVQALRPKAIQHPAHINWITQFDAAH